MTGKKIRDYALPVLLLGASVFVFFIFKPFLAPLALAIVFAVVLQPVHRRALRQVGGSAIFAALFTTLLLALAILIPIAFFGSELVREMQQLYSSLSQGNWHTLSDAIVQESNALDRAIPGSAAMLREASAHLDAYAKEAAAWLVGHLGDAFASVSSFVLALFVFFFALYYLLRDGASITEALKRISPLSDRQDAVLLDRLAVAVNSVVRGRLLVALIQGIFSGIGLALFGIPNALIWGLAAVISSLIPPFGTAFVLWPAALYALVAGAPADAIGLFVWGIISGLIDNIIAPKLMGGGADQHPLLTLLAILGGIEMFGPVGIFLGPLAVSLFFALLSLQFDADEAL